MLFKRMRSRLIIPAVFLILIIISFFSGRGLAQVYQTEPIVKSFAEFHIQSNQIINKYTNNLIDYFDSIDHTQPMPLDFTTKITPPDDLSPTKCESSLSSACLNYELNQNFDLLVDNLQVAINQIQITSLDNIASSNQNQSSQRYVFLQEQLDNSILTTQSSLRFYQQLLLAYPLHLSYQKTHDELDLLLQNLKQIEDYIKLYPTKYNNVSTPYCK